MAIFRNKKDIDDGLTPEEREKVAQYSACFQGPAGDFVVADLYLLAGMATSTFADVDFDPIRAAHRDGIQTLLKRILNYSGRTVYK
jgi:hypothetical protein